MVVVAFEQVFQHRDFESPLAALPIYRHVIPDGHAASSRIAAGAGAFDITASSGRGREARAR
jgi:hypothetical protein